MNRRYLSALPGAAALLFGLPWAVGDTLRLTQVDKIREASDLANLADAVGVRFEIFDFDAVNPHCVHFFVDEMIGSDSKTRHDGGGLCGLAGPQRLTVQWKADSGRLAFRFIRNRRDIEQGGSLTGPTLPIPDRTTRSDYGTKASELAYGSETVLVHAAYGPDNGPRTEFKVLAELRSNPNGIIGTE